MKYITPARYYSCRNQRKVIILSSVQFEFRSHTNFAAAVANPVRAAVAINNL